VDRIDAFDVIMDPELKARTTNLKRPFALKLAAQVVHDKWYDFEDPEDLARAIREKEFVPEKEMADLLLEFSGSIDAKTLDVLRDVGVGSPQIGAIGVGAQVKQEEAAPKPGRKAFGR
jgi:hypothetical protein